MIHSTLDVTLALADDAPSPVSSQGDEPSRKRLRPSDSQDSDVNPSATLDREGGEKGIENSTRDETYYFSDGSCIFRVENTLFNVHRTILCREESLFIALFKLPQGQLISEGTSDSNPIVLCGDKVDEFRSFLWALYALPPEHKLLFDTQYDMNKLMDIARISNKYSYKVLEIWACDAVQNNVARHTFDLDDANSEHREQVTRILRLARLCRHASLEAATVDMLRKQLSISPRCLAFILSLCDELETNMLPDSSLSGIRDVVGRAHFIALKCGPSFWNAAESPLPTHTKLCILFGNYNLQRKWIGFETGSTPVFTHSCNIDYRCQSAWQNFWSKVVRGVLVTKIQMPDILEKLECLYAAFDRQASDSHKYLLEMHSHCRNEGRKSIRAAIQDLNDNMVDYFPRV